MGFKDYILNIPKEIWRKIKKWYVQLSSEDRAGLYVTVIFHLVAVIVLLVMQIGSMLRTETSFVLDFSKQEEIEKLQKEVEFKEEISKRLDDLLNAAAAQDRSQIRNIAVDASQLKDDRGTDAKKLYEDARRLENELKNGSKQGTEEDARTETVEYGNTPAKKGEEAEYKGPSVVSYSLDGRKASSLRIPAYRCMGGGDVTVIITVDPQGNVVNAKVMDSVSSTDQCLRDFAVRAARLSKFSKLSPDKLKANNSLSRQSGEIVYRFIPQ